MALVLLVELQRSNGPKGNRPDPQANEQGGGKRRLKEPVAHNRNVSAE